MNAGLESVGKKSTCRVNLLFQFVSVNLELKFAFTTKIKPSIY